MLDEWDKSERFKKIAIIKERLRKKDQTPRKWRLKLVGWKHQVGDEDLLHPAGSGESSKKRLGPTQIGAF